MTVKWSALSSLQFLLAVAIPIPVVEVVNIDALDKAGCGVALFVLATPSDGGRGAGGRLHAMADGECE